MGPIPRSSRSLAPHMAQLAGAKANGAWEDAVSAHGGIAKAVANNMHCHSRADSLIGLATSELAVSRPTAGKGAGNTIYVYLGTKLYTYIFLGPTRVK
jgi:hypothetical protein